MKIEGENDCEKVIEDLLIALKGVSVAFTIREKRSRRCGGPGIRQRRIEKTKKDSFTRKNQVQFL